MGPGASRRRSSRRSPGATSFAGTSLYTNAWPQEPPDFTGKRVGLIGTGSSGVQATPELARDAAELYVFQRTPSYAWPAGNKPLDPDLQVKVKAQYRELRAEQRRNYGGVVGTSGAVAVPLPRDVAILEASPEERLEAVDELGWAACRAWSDVLRDTDANELGAELYREMIRRVIDDPETADGLSPRDLPIGCKRPILHTDYYETFNLDHVHLVDLRRGGIEEITPTGIRTAQGDYELDVIVFATGFDAMTGALDRIDIRGRDGLRLRDAWAEGARMLLGVQTVGFPNFFTITGPGSPSVLANMITGAEQHVEWIGGADRAHPRPVGTPRSSPRSRRRTHGSSRCSTVAVGDHVHGTHVQLVVPRRQHPREGACVPPVRRWVQPVRRRVRSRSRPPATRGSPSHERADARRSTSISSARSPAQSRTRRGSNPASSARWRGAPVTVGSGPSPATTRSRRRSATGSTSRRRAPTRR